MVATPDPEPEDDDEDTLSPLDAVPAVDTAVIPAAAIEQHLAQAESKPARRILPPCC